MSFFFFFFNFSYEYALLSYILFWYFLQVLKLHTIIHFVYGYICYWVSMLSRIFLVWVSPLFIKFFCLNWHKSIYLELVEHELDIDLNVPCNNSNDFDSVALVMDCNKAPPNDRTQHNLNDGMMEMMKKTKTRWLSLS